jgi:hypothetical protein
MTVSKTFHKVLIVSVIATIGFCAKSQKLEYGLTLGPGFSVMTYLSDDFRSELSNHQLQPGLSANLGGFVEYPLSSRWFLHAGASYQWQSVKTGEVEFYPYSYFDTLLNQAVLSASYSFNYHFIVFPVGIIHKISGLPIKFLVGVKPKVYVGNTDKSNYNLENGSSSYGTKGRYDAFNSFLMDAHLKIDYELHRDFSTGVFVDIPLRNMMSVENHPSGFVLWNAGISFSYFIKND